MEEALRKVDEGGCFKPSALEAAFIELDNKHRGRFSDAAGKPKEEWAKTAREEMREALAKTNKAKLQQKRRDDEKAMRTAPVESAGGGAEKVTTPEDTSRKLKIDKIGTSTPEAAEKAINLIPGHKGPMKVASCVIMR